MREETNPAQAQTEQRVPVWLALSELFLDTQLETEDFERLAQTLAASPYSVAKIEEILRFEVTPVLQQNLMSIAGEWAGFDPDWLCEKLAPRIDRRPWIRFPVFLTIKGDWRKIRRRLQEFKT
ncbi:MAG: hypothetical protein ACFCU3_07440 [Verrucomicrobiales bacterium]